MKKFFKALSGRPKDGDIVEYIKPSIAIPQLIACIVSMLMAIVYQSYFAGLLSIAFAWQLGWGMSIERFKKNI